MNRQAAMQTQPAEKATPAPSGVLQRTCACGQHTIAGGECEACRKERVGVLQRRAAISNEPTTVPPIASEVQRSPRQPLDVGTRAFIEPRFGHHFSRISTYTS